MAKWQKDILENGNPLKCLNITDEELEMLRDKFLGDNTRKLDLKQYFMI